MADTSTTALNIGSQRIAMAAFTNKGGKLTLTKYGSTAILADPVLDATRLPKVQTAITQLASGLKLGKGSVRYSISGQPVITRFVKLPPFDDEDVSKLIEFEAQQVIPIPMDEIVYDSAMINNDGLDKEAAIFAIKSEQLDEIHDAVTGAGLKSSEIDVSPVAIYNAFRYNYGAPEEPTLIVDIGARSSNLIFVEGDRFFCRTANIGGAAITAAIAKSYSVSFSDAEAQKTSNGLVALGGGHTSQLDEATNALAMTIRNAFSKLPAEISRTTNLYRSQHGGSAPAKVLLAGGGANLTYTREFFEEKLNVPVEVFNPLQRVAVAGSVDAAQVQADAHLMGELVGLAVRPTGKAAVTIDLVPSIVEAKRADDKRKPLVLIAAIVTIAAAAAWAMSKKGQAEASAEKVAEAEQQVQGANAATARIQRLLKEEQELNALTNNLATAESGRKVWTQILNLITTNASSQYYWTADLAPLVGYDPLDKNRKPIPAVIDGFAKVKANESIVPRATGNSNEINAIQINGFWRENPQGNRVVYEIISNLRANGSEVFSFETNRQGKTQPLEDSDILREVAREDEDTYAWPFEIIVPLKQPIQL